MRLHSIMPWPPIPLPPPRKPEKAKAAEPKRDLFGVEEVRVQPAHRKNADDLPPDYRAEVVGDYAYHHLRRPPRGYAWYRDADDYILAAAASGRIATVINSAD